MSTFSEGSRAILESGLSPADREVSVAGRDTIHELQEDLTTYNILIAYTRERLKSTQALMEEEHKASPELHKVIASAQEGLADFEQRFLQIGAQAEMFAQEPSGKSVKLEQFKKLRDEFRNWWNLSAGMQNILARVTHEFGQVENLGQAIFAPSEGEKRQHYARGFSEEVYAREREFTRELEVEDVALFNSGMSAIETILEAEELKKGDVVVAAEEFYVHTGFLLDALQKRGVKIIRVPSNDIRAFSKAIVDNDPKLVLTEVVSNAPKMEVAPVREVLNMVARQNRNREESSPRSKKTTRLVLDNTFLTPELLNLLQLADKVAEDRNHLPLAVVESATKHYQQGLDNITAGLVYSNDVEYMRALKAKRVMIGTHLQEQLARYIPPVDAQALTEKMLRHSSNALLLAEMLETVEQVRVAHPLTKKHPDKPRAERLFPQGAGGLFYVEWKGQGSVEDAVNRIKQMADERGVDIKIGVSFGHPQTWVETLRMPGTPKDAPQHIRISVGAENIAEFKKVIEVFEEALS